jgi:hypothetical protein
MVRYKNVWVHNKRGGDDYQVRVPIKPRATVGIIKPKYKPRNKGIWSGL